MLQTKLHKRGIDIKALDLGEVEPAAKSTVRQTATIRQGVDIENARKIVKIDQGQGA